MRERDELWEAMILALNLHGDGMTRPERGRINRALADLREVNATPKDILDRAARYRREWPSVEMTATSLVANWSRFGPQFRACTDGDVERVLTAWVVDHQRGTDRKADAERFMFERMDARQRADPCFRTLLNRLLEPKMRLTA